MVRQMLPLSRPSLVLVPAQRSSEPARGRKPMKRGTTWPQCKLPLPTPFRIFFFNLPRIIISCIRNIKKRQITVPCFQCFSIVREHLATLRSLELTVSWLKKEPAVKMRKTMAETANQRPDLKACFHSSGLVCQTHESVGGAGRLCCFLLSKNDASQGIPP